MSTFPFNYAKRANTEAAKVACSRCGQCCITNGLIPPLMPDEEAPQWLTCLVRRLRTEFGAIAENFPCVFLTDTCQCAIHDMARPSVCVDFACETEAARATGDE